MRFLAACSRGPADFARCCSCQCVATEGQLGVACSVLKGSAARAQASPTAPHCFCVASPAKGRACAGHFTSVSSAACEPSQGGHHAATPCCLARLGSIRRASSWLGSALRAILGSWMVGSFGVDIAGSRRGSCLSCGRWHLPRTCCSHCSFCLS